MRSLSKLAISAIAIVVPATVFAFSGTNPNNPGPPLQRTGAPIDGGITCTACHATFAPANSDARGSVRIETTDYRPGTKQKIVVKLFHPDAMRWGFQLTVRTASDETKSAGTLTQTPAILVRSIDTREFATHNGTSNFLGRRNGNTWELEWTPPATDVGDVTMYVAGNAANGNGNNQGDYIYTSNLRIKSAAPCALTETPRISAIRNAASYIDGPLSLNTFITIGGTGFNFAGVNRAAQASDILYGKYPTQLGCVAVEFNNKRAPLTFVNPAQINAQVPTINDLGPVQVRVIANPDAPNERRSDPFTVQMSDTSPAFFRLLPTPCIAGYFAGTTQLTGDPDLFPNVQPAKVGDVVTLFATGLGVTDPVYQDGEIPRIAAPLRDSISIEWIGRVMDKADILYAGAAPGNISGIYQINLRIPTYARIGVHNEVRIRAGNRLSPENTTLIVK